MPSEWSPAVPPTDPRRPGSGHPCIPTPLSQPSRLRSARSPGSQGCSSPGMWLHAAGNDDSIGMRHLGEGLIRDYLHPGVGVHRLDALAHDNRPNLRVRDRQLRDYLERAHEVERREPRVQDERDRLLIVYFCWHLALLYCLISVRAAGLITLCTASSRSGRWASARSTSA